MFIRQYDYEKLFENDIDFDIKNMFLIDKGNEFNVNNFNEFVSWWKYNLLW